MNAMNVKIVPMLGTYPNTDVLVIIDIVDEVRALRIWFLGLNSVPAVMTDQSLWFKIL